MASLHLDKLFHVLVVLGAAACADDDASRRDPPVDAAPGSADATSSGVDGGGEGAPCFCDSEACCDRGVSPPVVQDGFTCCWTTTCD